MRRRHLTRRPNRHLLAAALIGALLAPLPLAAQRRSADARAGIESARIRLDSVSRAGDAVASADLYTPDAIVSLGTLPDVSGRPALLAAMQSYFQRFFVREHRLVPAELHVYGDTAFERGTYAYVSGARGDTARTERGRYAAVWRRGADGRWRIHRYLENLLPATP